MCCESGRLESALVLGRENEGYQEYNPVFADALSNMCSHLSAGQTSLRQQQNERIVHDQIWRLRATPDSVRSPALPEDCIAMTTQINLRTANDSGEWASCPIQPDWVLEGTPTARIQLLSKSADRYSWNCFWDCTAGRFNWFYGFDETLHILEGGFTLKDLLSGTTYRVVAGDVLYLPQGARTEWTVEKYVRKLAFCRNAAPPYVVMARDAARRVKSFLRGQSGQPATRSGLSALTQQARG